MLSSWTGLLAWLSAWARLYYGLHSCLSSLASLSGRAGWESMLSYWAGLQIYSPAQAGPYDRLKSVYDQFSGDTNHAELPTKLPGQTEPPAKVCRSLARISAQVLLQAGMQSTNIRVLVAISHAPFPHLYLIPSGQAPRFPKWSSWRPDWATLEASCNSRGAEYPLWVLFFPQRNCRPRGSLCVVLWLGERQCNPNETSPFTLLMFFSVSVVQGHASASPSGSKPYF